MSNSSSDASWIKLADYGLHPHAQGLQRLDRPAAQRIVLHFGSLAARLQRYFGGVPVYIGHPDDPSYLGLPGHGDTRAYAWVRQLEARADGLWARLRWSQKGQELIDNAHYKHVSPRWKLQHNSDGSWQPVELISVGLTNTPNILGPVIANEKAPQAAQDPQDPATFTPPASDGAGRYHMGGLPMVACSLGLDPQASVDDITAAIKALGQQTAAVAERTALINAQLDLALERGQIALAEREAWLKRMSEDTTASNELMSIPRHTKATHTPFLSDALTPYQSARVEAKAQFVRAVEERMSNTGEDFSSAWNSLKKLRRDIFMGIN